MLVFRRRWKSSPTGVRRTKRNIVLILIILLLFMVQSFIYIEKNLTPPLTNLAKIRIKQIATQSINAAISDKIARNTNFDKLIDWRTDTNGKITGFMLNYAEHMKITADTISTVQNQLTGLKDIREHIPLGQAMNSTILASFGPNIPIRLVPAGAVKVDLDTRTQNAGINMILVEVFIRITAEVTVIIPFDAVPEIVETEVPISYALVVGDVPAYYYDGKGNPVGGGSNAPTLPNLALPKVSTPSTKEGAMQDAGKEGAGDIGHSAAAPK
ncbi:sporulation protein YunB [Paenibacillus sp. TAB 01]|uniref:sporulation protein YunB n=1 Tax=Paenibacillus sp. TAB 01 TaxID=3368988 RepID=UPI003753B9AB